MQEGFIYVPIDFRSRCKRHALERPRSVASRILYQQNLDRCRDQVLASGKVSVSIGSCHKKAAPSLSGSYCIHINQVSFTVVVEEI